MAVYLDEPHTKYAYTGYRVLNALVSLPCWSAA